MIKTKEIARGDKLWPFATDLNWLKQRRLEPFYLYAQATYQSDEQFNQALCLLTRPSIGVVGSRNMTEAAQHKTREIIGNLSRLRPVIVSGMASGIDSAAHLAAMEYGLPTVAILPDLEITRGEELRHDISQYTGGGLVVSEFRDRRRGIDPGDAFKDRDRLIAAMCSILIVIQSEENHGTQVTARAAHKFGRSVLLLKYSSEELATRPSFYAGLRTLYKEGVGQPVSVREIPELVEEAIFFHLAAPEQRAEYQQLYESWQDNGMDGDKGAAEALYEEIQDLIAKVLRKNGQGVQA